MDVSCNCFGVATAARVPVKRYNLLVPAIFPVTEPNAHKPVSIGVEKNIKRLSDYLERNEHRIPKVRICGMFASLRSPVVFLGEPEFNCCHSVSTGIAAISPDSSFGSSETKVWIC